MRVASFLLLSLLAWDARAEEAPAPRLFDGRFHFTSEAVGTFGVGRSNGQMGFGLRWDDRITGVGIGLRAGTAKFLTTPRSGHRFGVALGLGFDLSYARVEARTRSNGTVIVANRFADGDDSARYFGGLAFAGVRYANDRLRLGSYGLMLGLDCEPRLTYWAAGTMIRTFERTQFAESGSVSDRMLLLPLSLGLSVTLVDWNATAIAPRPMLRVSYAAKPDTAKAGDGSTEPTFWSVSIGASWL